MSSGAMKLLAQASRQPWRRTIVLWLSFVGLVSALVFLRGGPQSLFSELDPTTATGVCFDGYEVRLPCDFVKVYYRQGVSLRERPEAVRGFYYSPFFAVGMRSLAHLPFAVARAVWLSIVLLGVAALVCLPSLLAILTTSRASLAYVFVLSTSLPLLHDLLYGQVSSILLALVGLSYWAYQRKRGALSAALLGLATAIKFYPALFAIYYLLRRDVRATLQFSVTVLVCVVLIPWAVLGGQAYVAFVTSIARNLSSLQLYLETTAYSNAAVTVLPEAARVWFGFGAAARPAAVGLSVCVALVLLTLIARAARRNDSRSALLLSLAALPFVVRSCWVHYFVFLPLLQASVLVASSAKGASASLRWWGLFGSLISAAVISYPYFILVGDADSYYRAGFPFWATLVLLPALCLDQLRLGGREAPDSG